MVCYNWAKLRDRLRDMAFAEAEKGIAGKLDEEMIKHLRSYNEFEKKAQAKVIGEYDLNPDFGFRTVDYNENAENPMNGSPQKEMYRSAYLRWSRKSKERAESLPEGMEVDVNYDSFGVDQYDEEGVEYVNTNVSRLRKSSNLKNRADSIRTTPEQRSSLATRLTPKSLRSTPPPRPIPASAGDAPILQVPKAPKLIITDRQDTSESIEGVSSSDVDQQV